MLRDGPAARAGLSGNDVLVAIDGLKATPERIASTLTRYAPGETVEIHAFRRDELARFAVTLDAAPDDTCYLTLDSAPSAAGGGAAQRVAARPHRHSLTDRIERVATGHRGPREDVPVHRTPRVAHP